MDNLKTVILVNCPGIIDVSMFINVIEFTIRNCYNVRYLPSVLSNVMEFTIHEFKGYVNLLPEMPKVRIVNIQDWELLQEAGLYSPYLKQLKFENCDKLERLLNLTNSNLDINEVDLFCRGRSLALATPLGEVFNSIGSFRIGKVKNTDCFIPFLLSHRVKKKLELDHSNIPFDSSYKCAISVFDHGLLVNYSNFNA